MTNRTQLISNKAAIRALGLGLILGDSSGASSVSMDPTFTVQLAWKKCK